MAKEIRLKEKLDVFGYKYNNHSPGKFKIFLKVPLVFEVLIHEDGKVDISAHTCRYNFITGMVKVKFENLYRYLIFIFAILFSMNLAFFYLYANSIESSFSDIASFVVISSIVLIAVFYCISYQRLLSDFYSERERFTRWLEV